MGAKSRLTPRRPAATTPEPPRMLRVTYPNGQVESVPDDGRTFPPGTMIEWDERQPAGHDELRWCVTGGGWPFDD